MFRAAQWEEGNKKAVAQRLLVRTLLAQHPPTWSQRQCKRMNFVFHSGTTPARHQHSRTPKLCWSMSCSPAYLSSPCSSTCWSSSPSLTLGRYLACSSSSLLMFLVTFLGSYFWLDTQQPHDLTVTNMSFFLPPLGNSTIRPTCSFSPWLWPTSLWASCWCQWRSSTLKPAGSWVTSCARSIMLWTTS